MKIVIDGKIGSTLAEQLSREGHEVTIIDQNAVPLHQTVEDLDILCVEGNGAMSATQLEAGVDSADLLIAVTASDELNLLCCLVAKKLGARHTIARVRNPEYDEELNLISEDLGLSLSVNPELNCAAEIARTLRTPSAIKTDTFAGGCVEMLKFQLPPDSQLVDKQLMELPGLIKAKVLICAVERGENEVYIPAGTFRLAAGDRISFVASPGKMLVDADYSQIELRLLAHIADDETMIAAFRSGEDIHAVTASQVFGVPLDEVTPLQRSHAKAVNFGIVYGISAFSLAQDIGVFQSEAKAYMDSYFAKYHGVRDYMKRIVEQAKADGYVTTLFGRRRDLPELRSSNFNLRSFGERVALNMPIQGTAADIIKAAMVRVDARMRAEGLEAKLLLQVHDELIVECPAAEAETVRAILIEEMEHVVDYRVPLLVDAKIGASWAEAH